MTLHLNQLRRVQYFVLVLGLGIVLALGIGPTAAHAAAAAPKANCIGHDVHLHGSQPATITCWQLSTSSQAIAPKISWDHCTSSNARLEIISSTSGSYCFYDSGYLGLQIYYVTTVKSLTYKDWAGYYVYGSGWVLYYLYPPDPGTGRKFYFGNGNTYNCNNSVFCSGNRVKITQINLNA